MIKWYCDKCQKHVSDQVHYFARGNVLMRCSELAWAQYPAEHFE